MPGQLKGSREWRVTLATKWAYLDHLEAPEIVDRFEETHGIDISVHTVRDYLDEKEAQQVRDQIKDEHANVRLQIADREERLYQRARTAETQALEDQPIVRVVPKTGTVPTDRESTMTWPAWEIVQPGDEDYPEWAAERDIVIRFLGENVELRPGETYPLQAVDGSPRYTKEFDGMERDQPDLKGRAMARQEQSQHLEAKGEVLGVYEETINIDADVEQSLDDESESALLEAVEELRKGGDDS